MCWLYQQKYKGFNKGGEIHSMPVLRVGHRGKDVLCFKLFTIHEKGNKLRRVIGHEEKRSQNGTTWGTEGGPSSLPEEQTQGFICERLSCSAQSVWLWISRDLGGWKTGRKDGPLSLGVEERCTCACYWKLRVLLGGTPDSLPSPRTPGNQTHEKIVGVLSLDVIYFTTKINIFPRFHNVKDGKREGEHRNLQRVDWKNTGWTFYKYLPEWTVTQDTATGVCQVLDKTKARTQFWLKTK